MMGAVIRVIVIRRIEDWRTHSAYYIFVIRKMGFAGLATVDLVAIQVRVISQSHLSKVRVSNGRWLVEGEINSVDN
jgi:hypothetical protein